MVANFLAGCIGYLEFIGLCTAFAPLAWEIMKCL